MYFFFNDTATTEIYTYGHTLSLHDALPICRLQAAGIEVDDEGVETTDVAQGLDDVRRRAAAASQDGADTGQQFTRIERLARSEEHTSELQSLMRISYAVFCLQKKQPNNTQA